MYVFPRAGVIFESNFAVLTGYELSKPWNFNFILLQECMACSISLDNLLQLVKRNSKVTPLLWKLNLGSQSVPLKSAR